MSTQIHHYGDTCSYSLKRQFLRELPVPLQDVQRHVELRLVGGGRADQFAFGVSRDDSSVGQGESVQRAERMAIPQHCTERRQRGGN